MKMKGGSNKWLRLLDENPQLLECMQMCVSSLESTQAVVDA